MKVSFRTMLAQTLLLLSVVCFAAGGQVAAQTKAASGYEISREAVWEGISSFFQQHGWKDNILSQPSELQLPSGFVSREKNPDLEVTVIERNIFAHNLQIHMRCRERNACSSFLVLAPVAADSALHAQLIPFHLLRASTREISHQPSGPILVQPGKSAVLTMQSHGMRITLPVVCLQRGMLMQQISVRDPDTKRLFQATVVGPHQLQSVFE